MRQFAINAAALTLAAAGEAPAASLAYLLASEKRIEAGLSRSVYHHSMSGNRVTLKPVAEYLPGGSLSDLAKTVADVSLVFTPAGAGVSSCQAGSGGDRMRANEALRLTFEGPEPVEGLLALTFQPGGLSDETISIYNGEGALLYDGTLSARKSPGSLVTLDFTEGGSKPGLTGDQFIMVANAAATPEARAGLKLYEADAEIKDAPELTSVPLPVSGLLLIGGLGVVALLRRALI